MAEKLGTYHISSNPADYELARSNFFTFIVDDIETLVRSDFGLEEPEESDFLRGGQEALKLSVNKSSIPHFDIGVIEMRRCNSVIKYAGNPTFPEGSLQVQDFVGLKVKSILMAWQALAYDVVNDKGGRAADYKKKCTLIEYTHDHEKIREWELVGCWISSIKEDEYDVSSDSDRKIDCVVQYDRAIMHDPLV